MARVQAAHMLLSMGGRAGLEYENLRWLKVFQVKPYMHYNTMSNKRKDKL